MPSQSPVMIPAGRPVHELHRTVDLPSIGDLNVGSVLPSVPGWRDWFGSRKPHLVIDPSVAATGAYTKAIGDLAKFIFATIRPGPATTLTIVSPLALDGRSTVAANLALAWTDLGKRVLLIDADLRRPALGGLFSTAVRPLGLSNVLRGAVYWRDLLSPHPAHPNLQFLPAGSADLGDDLPRTELAGMLSEAKPFFDLIVLDSAPLLQHPQTVDLVAASDAVLLLARSRHTRQSDLVSTLGYLRRLDAKVIAIALNDV